MRLAEVYIFEWHFKLEIFLPVIMIFRQKPKKLSLSYFRFLKQLRMEVTNIGSGVGTAGL